MFTGIITNTTNVVEATKHNGGTKITLRRPKDWQDLNEGDSVAHDGACLTVVNLKKDSYDCFLMPETLKKTKFGQLMPPVLNLERPMQANDRFGGHFVQGHVDAVGNVTGVNQKNGYVVTIKFPSEFKKLVIPKGSITIDGVSLTIAELKDNILSVALIPHTLEHTNLDDLKPGDPVNLEFDMIGKYIVGAGKP